MITFFVCVSACVGLSAYAFAQHMECKRWTSTFTHIKNMMYRKREILLIRFNMHLIQH